MEGTLSKWTNVLNGWQYRYFVLNDDSLRYFTSRDKMIRGQQRGCIRLNNAAIGIEEENTSLFTVTGKDKEERDVWVRELERVIHLKSGYYRPRPEDPLVDLQTRATMSERQLQDLLEIVHKLEQLEHNTDKSSKINEKKKRYLNEVIQTTKRLQSTVEHSNIILKQVEAKFSPRSDQAQDDKTAENASNSRRESDGAQPNAPPQVTYSSSEEDEFFDATSGINDLTDESDTTESCTSDCTESAESTGATTTNGPSAQAPSVQQEKHKKHHDSQSMRSKKNGDAQTPTDEKKTIARRATENDENEPDWGDNHENFDEIYENTDESELGNVQQQHGSVLMHLLSQVSVGMDLTKVTLPTFILERRSLLEMYADFFAHPEDFIHADELTTPEERMISVVKYYLNAFYPARKSGVAKKPYNPILGETFRCRWTIPGTQLTGKKTESGPFPGSDTNQVTFIAEQVKYCFYVSHHPPVSAFYAEHPEKRISLSAHIWTKSSFLGLSIGVANIGSASVTLHNFDEQYVVTFPHGYGRSIMSTPWVELGGKVEVVCEKSGYHAEIEFLTKPLFGGKPHKISGSIFKSGHKKPIMTLRGEWNGLIYAKHQNASEEFLFTDVKEKPEVQKECEPVNQQTPRESRRLWRHVTVALFRNKINVASSAKRWIEQRQRDEAKQRQETGAEHQQKFFRKIDQGGWEYLDDLKKRS
ncbi:Oxysterol-binding protein-related protein 9 [Aphelenchoides bicaudatus]|nr:Oxysterol-binding protein-related protein 9 [Aphelenchoides bicaudatus]